MFSGIAAQLIATKGCSARDELLCIKRANTSLPVPLSPVIIIEASLSATRLAIAANSLDAASAVIISVSLPKELISSNNLTRRGF